MAAGLLNSGPITGQTPDHAVIVVASTNDALRRSESREMESVTANLLNSGYITDQTPDQSEIDVAIAPTDDLPRSKSKILRRIKWSLLLGSFALEGSSLTFDQLSAPKKPIYAFMSMITASLGLLISIIELSFRVRENNMIISRLLGDALENFGFFCSTWQSIYAVLQYVYIYEEKINNPIKISALPLIFLVCEIISRLYNNYRHDSSTQRHIREESSRDASRATTLSRVEGSVSASNARAIEETEPVEQDDGVLITTKKLRDDTKVQRRTRTSHEELFQKDNEQLLELQPRIVSSHGMTRPNNSTYFTYPPNARPIFSLEYPMRSRRIAESRFKRIDILKDQFDSRRELE